MREKGKIKLLAHVHIHSHDYINLSWRKFTSASANSFVVVVILYETAVLN
jgi:hypothetical protein